MIPLILIWIIALNARRKERQHRQCEESWRCFQTSPYLASSRRALSSISWKNLTSFYLTHLHQHQRHHIQSPNPSPLLNWYLTTTTMSSARFLAPKVVSMLGSASAGAGRPALRSTAKLQFNNPQRAISGIRLSSYEPRFHLAVATKIAC